MKGAIAAGHELTAEAGARVLAEGGNAVDACVAAGFASWVAESPLTGPGGGGFMLVHRARDRSTRVLDFFTAMPGRGRKGPALAVPEAVDVDFSGGTNQIFQIGPASVAVPGTARGLEEAHRLYGSLPWRELVAPAAELARTGFELTRPQAYLHAILDLILRRDDEGRRIYGQAGERLAAGDTLRLDELGRTLDRVAAEGSAPLYDGELAFALTEATGGVVTSRDLAEYRTIVRKPVLQPFRGAEFRSNPPPSAGGRLVARGLARLDEEPDGPPGSAEAIDALAAAMRDGVHALVSGTTHVSVVDADGNAAAMTCSTGSGSGVFVPGSGIQLNNMLGEFFLARSVRAGQRLSSMMSPSIITERGRVRLVVGSAGSLRLRGAVLQVVVNVVGHGLGVEEAIERPRVHLEGDHLHCEGGNDPAALDRLEQLGWDVVRWRRRNLYFGGAAAVELRSDGTLAASGDPRRGGHGIVVP
ncbi:MAG: gamma-glutamyltransferase [Gaiellaceae bacterium]